MLNNIEEKLRQGCLWSLLVLWGALTFSSALVEISFMTALICWLSLRLKAGQWLTPAISKGTWITLLLFFLWCSLTLIWTEGRYNTFRGILKIAQQAMIFIMAADIFSSHLARKRWQIVFVIFFLILVTNGWYQYFMGKDLIRGFGMGDSTAGWRVTSSFKTYGLLAAYLATTLLAIFMIGIQCRENQKWQQWYTFLIAFLVGLPILALTRTRGAILAFLVGTFLLLIYRKKWLIIVGLLCCLAGGISVLPKTMVLHLDIYRKEQSLVERYHLWRRALHVVKAKPITGTGLNTYAMSHAKYDKTKNWRVRNYYAHNGYLQMAAEIGIPGLLFFLAFILSFIRVGWIRLRKGEREQGFNSVMPQCGLFFGALNFLILAVIDTVMHNPQPVMTFWYVLGLFAAYSRSAPSEAPPKLA